MPQPPQGGTELERRLHRQVMALASWMMFLLPLAYAVHQGWMAIDWRGLALFFGLTFAFNVAVYLLVRSGATRRLRDPSLTFLQILVAQAVALAMLHYALDPTARSVLLMLFVSSLFFGVFGLDARRFLALVATATGGYLALVLYENRSVALDDPRLRPEWMRLLSLAMILSWLALLGSYVAGLRAQLLRRNEELARAGDRLKRLVSHDELTGVFNRRHLLGILGREKERAERFGHVFSVCLLDLDHFKQVNDTHGHAAGDDVLKGFAARMLACARKIDWLGRQPRGAAVAPDVATPGEAAAPVAARVPHRLGGASAAGRVDAAPASGPPEDGLAAGADHTFGRYGGEEFLLVLPHTPLSGARRAIERLRELVLAAAFDTRAGPLRVTFSAGIAEHRPGEAIADTLARADAALYGAKASGRDRTELAD